MFLLGASSLHAQEEVVAPKVYLNIVYVHLMKMVIK